MFRFAMSAAVGFILSTAASAATLAVDPTGGTLYERGSFTNFGYSFTTSEARIVTALAIWDYQSDGLVDAHPVGLWNSDGTLLSSAVVTGSDPLFDSVSIVGDWRIKDVADFQLAAGTYVIGAYYPTTGDVFRASTDAFKVSVNPAPWLTYGVKRYAAGDETLSFPNAFLSDSFSPGDFGPNFLSTAVPEPASWAMLVVGFGLVGMATRRRGLYAQA